MAKNYKMRALDAGDKIEDAAGRTLYRCEKCFKFFELVYIQIHHRLQKQHGGDNSPDNLNVVCDKCHREIHAKQLPKWLVKNDKSIIESLRSKVKGQQVHINLQIEALQRRNEVLKMIAEEMNFPDHESMPLILEHARVVFAGKQRSLLELAVRRVKRLFKSRFYPAPKEKLTDA